MPDGEPNEECQKLARYYLEDGADIYTEENIKLLAKHIQESIEFWVAAQEQ